MATRKVKPAPLPKSDVEFPDPVKPDLIKKEEFPMDEATFQKTVLDTLIKSTAVTTECKSALNTILKNMRAGKF